MDNNLGSVSRKFRIFSGLYWMPQFSLYFCNVDVQIHRILQCSWLFIPWNMLRDQLFKTSGWYSLTTRFSGPKSSRNFGQTGPLTYLASKGKWTERMRTDLLSLSLLITYHSLSYHILSFNADEWKVHSWKTYLPQREIHSQGLQSGTSFSQPILKTTFSTINSNRKWFRRWHSSTLQLLGSVWMSFW